MSTAVNTNTLNDVAAWHAISQAEVVKRLVTNSEKGLNLSEASARLHQYGPNRLPEGRKQGPFTRFFAQFNNVLIYVLLAAGFTKLMLSLWIDVGIIFAVVILNALLGFIQEGKAEKALDSNPPYAVSRGLDSSYLTNTADRFCEESWQYEDWVTPGRARRFQILSVTI